MYKKIILLALLLIGLATTSGCWSRKELNEIAVVMALGIDRSEEGYSLTAQVLNSGETGATHISSVGSLPVVTYHSTGQTVPDALQRMLSMAPRIPYLSHLRVVVFGEELAREGVQGIIDYISRNHELRTDFFLLVAKGSKAAEILNVVTPFESVPANSLYTSILASQKKWAATGKITLQHFITELNREGSDPVLSGVQIVGKGKGANVDNVRTISPQVLLQHTGLAVFKKDRLVGWLKEPPSKAVNYVLNQVDTTEGFASCRKEGTVGFEVIDSKSHIKVSTDSAGKPDFLVFLDIEANISTIDCEIDLTNPESIQELEQVIMAKVKNNISKHIRTVQQDFGADVFAFGEALHRQHPKVWAEYRKKWDKEFKEVSIEVDGKLAIRKIGSIVQPIQKVVDTS